MCFILETLQFKLQYRLQLDITTVFTLKLVFHKITSSYLVLVGIGKLLLHTVQSFFGIPLIHSDLF